MKNATIEFNKVETELNNVLIKARTNIANLTNLVLMIELNAVNKTTAENEMKRLKDINATLENKYNQLMQRHLTLALIVSICNN